MTGERVVGVFVGGPLDGRLVQLEAATTVYRVPRAELLGWLPGGVEGDVPLLQRPPDLEYQRDLEPLLVVAGQERRYAYRLRDDQAAADRLERRAET